MTVQRKRHIAKSLTWRIVASITTFLIGWLVTGNMEFGMTIGGFDVVIKIILYYFHERVWYHSKFGIIENIEEPKKTKKEVTSIPEIEKNLN